MLDPLGDVIRRLEGASTDNPEGPLLIEAATLLRAVGGRRLMIRVDGELSDADVDAFVAKLRNGALTMPILPLPEMVPVLEVDIPGVARMLVIILDEARPPYCTFAALCLVKLGLDEKGVEAVRLELAETERGPTFPKGG